MPSVGKHESTCQVWDKNKAQTYHEHLSLKVQKVEFDISVPPGKKYIENLASNIAMKPYNSMQMSIQR